MFRTTAQQQPSYERVDTSPYQDLVDNVPPMAENLQSPEGQLLEDQPNPPGQHGIYPPQFNRPSRGQRGPQSINKPFFLREGNFVVDCALSPHLRGSIEDEDEEFTYTRYTAVTCGPDDFYDEGFTLRQALFATPRRTKIMINIYMYNEGDLSFADTMASVCDNIQTLCDKWGDQSWKNIVVCVLSAGRYNIDPQTKALLSVMGIYQEGVARRQVNSRDVTAHLYEHTTRVGLVVESNRVRVVPKRYRYPIQTIFCLEEKNKTKVHSDKWAYRGLARLLDPTICVPIPDESRLSSLAIYQLWKAFEVEPRCAVAFGRAKPEIAGFDEVFNLAQSACNFEQHLQNSLSLPFGASFGFASVSRNLFHAFRYEALKDDEAGKSSLDKYFETIRPPDPLIDTTISSARAKLASLQLVFFSLITKPSSRWVTRYVNPAVANVYMVNTIGELLSMRRRTIIPYFLDTCYAITHYREVLNSSHSILRKAAFAFQFALEFIEVLLSWFALGNMFIFFKVLTTSVSSPGLLGTGGYITAIVLEWFYDVSLAVAFISSLSRTWKLNGLIIAKVLFPIWLVIISYTFACYCLILHKATQVWPSNTSNASQLFETPAISLGIAALFIYALWIIASLLISDLWPIIISSIQYLFLTPYYINVSDVIGFCDSFNLSNIIAKDDPVIELPKAETQNGKGRMDVLTDEGLDEQYEQQLMIMRQRIFYLDRMASPLEQAQRPQNARRMLETLLVIAWTATNFVLVFVVLSIADVKTIDLDEISRVLESKGMRYIAGVMWALAGLTAAKVIGSLANLAMTFTRNYWGLNHGGQDEDIL